MADYKFDTLTLHAGQSPDARFGSRAVPIHQTTSYVFDSTEHAAALFNMEVGGHVYSRLTNPTVAVLEQRLAALDRGVAAVATASGMSALFVTVLALCSTGDHIVSSSQMYGANINLFEHPIIKRKDIINIIIIWRESIENIITFNINNQTCCIITQVR